MAIMLLFYNVQKYYPNKCKMFIQDLLPKIV